MVRVSVTVTSGLLLISQLAEGPAPYRSPSGLLPYGPQARVPVPQQQPGGSLPPAVLLLCLYLPQSPWRTRLGTPLTH